ncbi:hypothetical protein CP97_02885 [Aurantiacibacter atlanticus]|uniref:Gene transfer agent protein n=1 Tax=Aurantiacibacter atlanticus TaxID=1648404 RepID=A0A0H4VDR0_9SPHN|nr:gene transfer agent family protein [Aurantiacibacter atlanticus]AKQ41214.1 hypothetical protein CP97_02885 [Aurantiacibacter atlanticus]MDF1835213.1 gene transfer agent family protein [Alteraurantiacibacter sp. bin_em_oilr2.035]
MSANPERGEAAFMIAGTMRILRPSFTALVAAEEELGPLFTLVEQASEGELRLADLAALFWHCLVEQGQISREDVGEAVMQAGLASAMAPLRILLAQILQGRV